jgi:thioredoxin-dependent peroxiredoxin
MALKKGKKAPNFQLPSTAGGIFELEKDGLGKPYIIYFYPKDFTSGCTEEACEFRDHFETFRDLDITILGISRDDMVTHLEYKKEYNLPFDLLSDREGRVCKKYDALMPVVRKPKRVTYFLDKEHIIRGVYGELMESKMHVEEMLKLVK